MSAFERYLAGWVCTCIVVGTAAGHYCPDLFQAIGRMELRAGQRGRLTVDRPAGPAGRLRTVRH